MVAQRVQKTNKYLASQVLRYLAIADAIDNVAVERTIIGIVYLCQRVLVKRARSG
jgi:hypothetical protein